MCEIKRNTYNDERYVVEQTVPCTIVNNLYSFVYYTDDFILMVYDLLVCL